MGMNKHLVKLCFFISSLPRISLHAAEDPLKDFYQTISRYKPELAAERAELAQAVFAAYPDEAPKRWQTIGSCQRLMAQLESLVGPKTVTVVSRELANWRRIVNQPWLPQTVAMRRG